MLSLSTMRIIAAALFAFLLIVLAHFAFPKEPLSPQLELVKILFHEVGFALVVALLIWGLFEYFSNAESEEQWNRRIDRIAKSVFFGVFRRNFPPELIHEANVLLLEQSFVRLGFHVTYTLNDDSYVHEGREISFVRLEAVARYKIKNVSNVVASCPIAIGLPNPLQEVLKSKCRVNRLVVKRKGINENINLDGAEEKFRLTLSDNSSYNARYAIEPIKIAPDEEVEIIWDYAMAKEDEDTEIGQTLYPTDSITIAVMDTNPTRRIVRARSIHPAPLENDTSAEAKGTYIFRLERYMLPHQGFAIWWKRRPETQPSVVEQ